MIAIFVIAAVMTGASEARATAFFSGGATFDPPGTQPARGVSASAQFTISGAAGARQLTILLTNTDFATGAEAPDYYYEVLTGLFFNLGSTAFTPVSASIVQPGGSIVQSDKCDTNCVGATNVGGEWSYASGNLPSGYFTGTNQGVSTGYLNANTNSGNFGGTNYEQYGSNPNTKIGGIEFGIVPDGFVANSGLSDLDAEPLIEGTVKFVLNIPDGLQESDIKDVYFTYGDKSVAQYKNFKGKTTTTTSGGSTGGTVPEPAALSLLGLALAGISYRLRRPAGATP